MDAAHLIKEANSNRRTTVDERFTKCTPLTNLPETQHLQAAPLGCLAINNSEKVANLET